MNLFQSVNRLSMVKSGRSRPFSYMRNIEQTLKICMFFNFSVLLKKGHIHIKVGDKIMKQKQRGRPNLCRGTKERKKVFDNRLQGLKEALSTLPEDAVIYMLMEEIKGYRNCVNNS